MSWFENSDPRDVFDDAAEWVCRIQADASVRNSREFQEWVGMPEHSAVFDAMLSSMETIGEQRRSPRIQRMHRAAIARLQIVRVAALFSWRSALLAASILLAIFAGGAVLLRNAQTQAYATGSGERRTVTLSDGSRIVLDSGSRVNIRYTEDTRSITMEKGRARFDVAHDVKRPFLVTAGAETVVAVGTAFAVEKLQAKVLVTLIQGRVLVQQTDPGGADGMQPQPTTALSPGEQLTETRDGRSFVRHVDLNAETAWESGRLVFRGVSLGDAVEEMNRYTDRPIMVDPAISEIEISGVFNAGDVGIFVKAVTAYLPVSATTNTNDVIVLSHRL